LLTSEAEDILLVELMRFPEMVESAAAGRAPQVMAHYLRDTAAAFHAFYNALPILTAEEETRHARLGLCKATQQVLANGLALLGVSAPETM
jgi:arginyl-tRNA synthetase